MNIKKEQLRELINEFVDETRQWRIEGDGPITTVRMPTFDDFIRWLAK